eukprot:10394205-Lingulodinium_polyedra.AAC.1
MDDVGAESICALSSMAVYTVVEFFRDRFMGVDSSKIESWLTFILILIAKETRASKLSQFRGIALLSCVGK